MSLMKRIALIYGSISGIVTIGSMLLMLNSGGEDTDFGGAEWAGYLIMLLALSAVFLGIKRYRDDELGGVIRFGTGLLVGLGITLIASVVYVFAWEVYLSFTDYTFIDTYTDSMIAAKEAAGLAGAALQAEIDSLEQMRESYASLWFRMPMTFLEIFPVGLLISLVSAGLLRNSNLLPAETTASA
jgi:Protein of unknown function (DUF4199)